MQITKSWLEQLLGERFNYTAEQLADSFNRLGIEVDAYSRVVNFSGPIVIGRVESITELTEFKKPIRYCQVAVGIAENGDTIIAQIICGAQNFRQGDRVVAALPGAVLPGDFQISARKTYGKTSEGMLCSYVELGLAELGDHEDGIIIITEDIPIGTLFADAVGLDKDDHQYTLEITPDRGYLLSARGIARDLAALMKIDYSDPVQEIAAAMPEKTVIPRDVAHVIIQPGTKVQRFALINVIGCDPMARTPWWLKLRLATAGIRSISVPVDITNYVMLELGQPMHAYDGDVVGSSWEIRKALPGESMVTLDEKTRQLDPDDVVISDETGIIGLAGVMGAHRGEVSQKTTSVIFEAAVWDPATVFRSSKRHKLTSEAARRYIRAVDVDIALVALWKAATLLTEIAGGEISTHLTDHIGSHVQLSHQIVLPPKLANNIVGADYSVDDITGSLQRLGCEVQSWEDVYRNDHSIDHSIDDPSDDSLSDNLFVTTPSWRPDLREPIDLVEEIVRLAGFDDIVSRVPCAPAGNSLASLHRRITEVARTAAEQGLIEVPAGVFCAPEIYEHWELPREDRRRDALHIINPLEVAKNTIATTLLPGIMETAARNLTRANKNLSIFTIGQVAFASGEELPILSVDSRPDQELLDQLNGAIPQQEVHFAALFTGLRILPGLGHLGREASYRDAIEIAHKILGTQGIEYAVTAAQYPPFHPGRCAQFRVSDQIIGYAGQLHPGIAKKMHLPENTSVVELTLDALTDVTDVTVRKHAPEISPYPAVFQDLAVIVDINIPANAVEESLKKGAGPLLESIRLFDVYTGPTLGEGRKSMTYELVFRSPSRTLTEDEASLARDNAVEQAYLEFGAIIRGPQYEQILAALDHDKDEIH